MLADTNSIAEGHATTAQSAWPTPALDPRPWIMTAFASAAPRARNGQQQCSDSVGSIFLVDSN